jgi:hypothetical protein
LDRCLDGVGQTAELLPVGRDVERVAIAHRLLGRVVVADALEQVVLVGIEPVSARFVGGQRVVGANGLHAAGQQRFDDAQRGRVAHVVGALLECQPQQRYRLLVEAELCFVDGTVDQVVFWYSLML